MNSCAVEGYYGQQKQMQVTHWFVFLNVIAMHIWNFKCMYFIVYLFSYPDLVIK